MRYLSVCSGIEAASVAWHHLGWQPVGFSEIEAFPSAVLAHRFPNVPNYGDMTRHGEWPLGPGSIDLLVGGTPCQSFSVAGLRKGLSDPRGGLMLTYLEIARRLRPRWIVWENVPGVLSSGRGRDLGAFLGALGELGYGWAYRVLDAQWVRTQRHPRAVPQRRRRIFVVGCLGDGAAAAQVLFERESVCRDSAPRRAAREGAPADAEAGVRAGCVTSHDVAPCLETTSHDYSRADNWTMVSGTLGNRGLRSHTEIDGHGAYIPVAFRKSRRAQSVNDHETWVAAEQANTLNQFDTGERDTHAVLGTDCYNGAITGDVAATMGTPGSSVNASGPTVMAFANRTRDGIKVPEVMEDGIVPSLTNPGDGGRSDAINVAVAQAMQVQWASVGGQIENNTAQALRSNAEYNYQFARVAMTVRRLTPRECERLQGFPDDWTMIPWRKKIAEDCPDGPRYKALGNSMAVNVMAWIGERIDNYERTGNAVRTEG